MTPVFAARRRAEEFTWDRYRRTLAGIVQSAAGAQGRTAAGIAAS